MTKKRDSVDHLFKKYPVAFMVVFIWIGFVCSISFMEAWLKFRAANVTLPIGLSIGRLIFNALNKVEWFFVVLISVSMILGKKKIAFRSFAFFCIPVTLLAIQTFLLLPTLSLRVDMILQGKELSSSFLHFYYIIMEVLKVIFLFIFGINLFQSISYQSSAKTFAT